jgi:SAM-dependent methyltransferase
VAVKSLNDDAEVANLQDIGHPDDHDYVVGSPHLMHRQLNEWMVETVRAEVINLLEAHGHARVLEVGAGHGTFTDHALAAGAQVTLTEMSRASAGVLERRYAHNPAARVIFDPAGESEQIAAERFDLVLCISVLHHVPDYLEAIGKWVSLIDAGGSFVSFQDPLWYPRRSRLSLAADRGAYYLWRLGRGDRLAGVKSVVRRKLGQMDAKNPRDMVEYHVLRQGCDEQAIAEQLSKRFATVEVLPYWSAISRTAQRAGNALGLTSTFGVTARGKTS